jgi:ferredoxin
MKVEIRVDRRRCIGSGQCVHWAPGVFDQDDDGIAAVVDPVGEAGEKVVHAVTACPMQAITLRVAGNHVGPDELRDWVLGIHSTDPVVPLLEQLGDEHYHLHAALTESPSDDDITRAEAMCSLTTAHLRNEEQVYPALAALVETRLVDAFEADHARIDQALGELAAHRRDPAARRRAMRVLARVVCHHIRLEETVLFPLALAALARGRPPQDVAS